MESLGRGELLKLPFYGFAPQPFGGLMGGLASLWPGPHFEGAHPDLVDGYMDIFLSLPKLLHGNAKALFLRAGPTASLAMLHLIVEIPGGISEL